jgi:hypothetical protein
MKLITIFLFALIVGSSLAIPRKTISKVKPVLDKLNNDLDAENNKVLKQNDMKALHKSLNDFKIQFTKAKNNYENYQRKYSTADQDFKKHTIAYLEEKNLINHLYTFIKVYENEDSWIHLNCMCNSSKIYKF